MKLELIETLLLAAALGCDAFAVGLGVGTRCCKPRQVFRLSFHFGLFQFLMPLVGWLVGQNALGFTRQWAPWIAFALLFFIGAKMSYEGLKPGNASHQIECPDPTRGFSLVTLSLATSMDALGVGFGLGILGQELIFPALLIGVTACAMTWVAMKLGNRLSEALGRRVGTLGGFILIAIALKLLLT
jgi:putative Mn2+ efflux pump MntP